MSKINKALAVLAVLAFFFPFITISCNNQQMAHMNGYKLVQCAASSCSAKDIVTIDLKLPGMETESKSDPSPALEASNKSGDLNYVLFAAIAAVVAIITLFVPGRTGELLSGIASVASIALLFLFRSKFLGSVEPHLNSPEMKAAGMLIAIQVQMGMGFWLSMALSAVSAILAFKGTSAAPSSAASSGGAVGGFTRQPSAGASPGPGQQMSVCPSCGANNAPGAKFCLSCGASLTSVAPPVHSGISGSAPPSTADSQGPPASPSEPRGQQGNACPSCGAGNPAGNKFCLSCGGSLMSNVQLFQPKETTVSAPPPPVATAPPAPPADQADSAVATLSAPATMAAAAAASSSAAQPLPVTAPRETYEPPPTTSSSVPEMYEQQPSLDLQAPLPEPEKAKGPVCSACGAAITAGQKFCLSCGTPVGQAAKPAEAAPQVSPPEPLQPEQPACAACNAPLSEGQKFCLSCGTPVAQASAVATPVAQPSPLTTETRIATPDLYRPTAEAQIFQPQPKSSAKPIILGVVLLGIFGAAGWFGWKYFARPDVTIATFPQKTHVAVGGRTSLQASVSGSKDTDVDWKVEEGAKGGQVNALGSVMASGQVRAAAIYNAPQTGGVFHVIVSSHANPARTAKIEIVVGGLLQPETATSTPPPASTPVPTATNPMAAQIVGTWRGPSPGMQTVIGPDSTIAMTSETDATKNLNGTYHFTDNSRLQIDFGNGDVRTWTIVGVDNNYLRITSQSKDGSSAIIFAKAR